MLILSLFAKRDLLARRSRRRALHVHLREQLCIVEVCTRRGDLAFFHARHREAHDELLRGALGLEALDDAGAVGLELDVLRVGRVVAGAGQGLLGAAAGERAGEVALPVAACVVGVAGEGVAADAPVADAIDGLAAGVAVVGEEHAAIVVCLDGDVELGAGHVVLGPLHFAGAGPFTLELLHVRAHGVLPRGFVFVAGRSSEGAAASNQRQSKRGGADRRHESLLDLLRIAVRRTRADILCIDPIDPNAQVLRRISQARRVGNCPHGINRMSDVVAQAGCASVENLFTTEDAEITEKESVCESSTHSVSSVSSVVTFEDQDAGFLQSSEDACATNLRLPNPRLTHIPAHDPAVLFARGGDQPRKRLVHRFVAEFERAVVHGQQVFA